MKTMKSILACLAVTSLPFCSLAADSPSFKENLPSSWCTLPEDTDSRFGMEEAPATLTKAQKTGIDRVLDANQDAFSMFESRNASRSMEGWRLEACMTDLSLSASGVLGVLVAGGEASVSLYWRRPKSRYEESMEAGGYNVEIPTDATPAQIERAMEPVIRAVMGTGRVKDETAMRGNLNDYAKNTREMAQYLCQVGKGNWKVGKLRTEISVDASGKYQGVTLGGAVRIRFDWVPKKLKATPLVTSQENALKGEGLKRLAHSLVQVFQNADFTQAESNPMKLKEVSLGLGLFGEANVGVAKVGVKAFGYIGLVPNTTREEQDIVGVQTDIEPIPIIDYSGNANWQSWAEARNIPYQVYASRDGQKSVVYNAVAKMMQNGLTKANRIANSIGERTNKNTKGGWEVYQVKAGYSLSLSGDLVLFKLGGAGTVDFAFAR